MKLEKLFEAQQIIDANVTAKFPLAEGEDRTSKKILALQMKLGKLSNEWRGFMYWVTDQSPRTEKKIMCHSCEGLGKHILSEFSDDTCLYCSGTGVQEDTNPLLEAYLNCLRFILSLGNEAYSERIIDLQHHLEVEIERSQEDSTAQIIDDFIFIIGKAGDYRHSKTSGNYIQLFAAFVVLGAKLGFSWQQIDEAYLSRIGHSPANPTM